MSWKERDFTELGSLSRGRSRHRPRNDESLYGGPYPFVQTSDIKFANLYLKNFSQTYSEKGLHQSRLWPAGTLCITIAANIAETAILGMDACFPDSVLGFLPYEGVSDVRFVKYFFDIFKERMQKIAVGAAQDNLSLEKLLSFRVLAPSYLEQRRIADILSAYDDLIENNMRRIQLLEEAALCQYRLLISENAQHHTPTTLGKVLELRYGKALKSTDRVAGQYPVFGSSGQVGSHQSFLVEGPGVIVGRKGNVGSVFWSADSFYPIDTVYYVSSELSLYYLYHNLKYDQHFDNSDAAVPGLNRTHALSNKILVPPPTALGEFDYVCHNFFALKSNFEAQNGRLREARDILLPRLMSGEINVSNTVDVMEMLAESL